jgi:nitroimidazol reductase NimA-like FMN-containing flavoprotein (pyridoxamine 5'-phosphate oxidase superfamily)
MEQRVDRTRIRRHPERSVPGEFNAIMAAGHVAHVAFCAGGEPYVTPLTYHYDAGKRRLYLHAAPENHTLQQLCDGAYADVCVTIIDGLVFSRTAMNHSMNYRSAVCFGRCTEVHDAEEKRAAFEAMTARYFPGRTSDVHYSAATPAQLEATRMVAMDVDAFSAKARRGGPTGPTDSDPDAFGTCGVVDL